MICQTPGTQSCQCHGGSGSRFSDQCGVLQMADFGQQQSLQVAPVMSGLRELAVITRNDGLGAFAPPHDRQRLGARTENGTGA